MQLARPCRAAVGEAEGRGGGDGGGCLSSPAISRLLTQHCYYCSRSVLLVSSAAPQMAFAGLSFCFPAPGKPVQLLLMSHKTTPKLLHFKFENKKALCPLLPDLLRFNLLPCVLFLQRALCQHTTYSRVSCICPIAHKSKMMSPGVSRQNGGANFYQT